MQVHTIKGLVDRSALVAKDIIEEHDNARNVITEWFLGDEMVRRDVHVSILRGHDIFGEQANLG
jgi:hypothetical protein